MCDTEVCRGVLEQALEMEIEQVIIDKEKSIIYNPEYKGVRLDIIAKDEQRTRYNIEMQIRSKPALGKRPAIIIARLVWSCWRAVWIINFCRMLM